MAAPNEKELVAKATEASGDTGFFTLDSADWICSGKSYRGPYLDASVHSPLAEPIRKGVVVGCGEPPMGSVVTAIAASESLDTA